MDMIGKLRDEQRALRQRIEEIDNLIEEYQKWEARVASVVQTPTGTNAITAMPQTEETNPGPPVTQMHEFEAAVKEALMGSETPLNRTDLLAGLEAAGVVVGGVEPRNTLSARLSRMDGIVNLKGHGYWPAGRSYDPAGYVGKDVETKDEDQHIEDPHTELFG